MKPWFGDVLRVSTSQAQGRHVLDYMASRSLTLLPKSLSQTNPQKMREKKHTKDKNLNNP